MKITGGKIALFALAAAGAALGVYLSTEKGRANARNFFNKANDYLQTSDTIAFLGEKIGLVNKGTQRMVEKTARAADKTMNKVLN
jgi:transposase-like protein